jgi:hypothetical protein
MAAASMVHQPQKPADFVGVGMGEGVSVFVGREAGAVVTAGNVAGACVVATVASVVVCMKVVWTVVVVAVTFGLMRGFWSWTRRDGCSLTVFPA